MGLSVALPGGERRSPKRPLRKGGRTAGRPRCFCWTKLRPRERLWESTPGISFDLLFPYALSRTEGSAMNPRSFLTAVALAAAGAALAACQQADQGQDETAGQADDAGAEVVQVVAEDFEFEAPEAIPSGWTTFQFENASDEQEHFFLLYRLPEDKTFADYRSEVARTFLDVWRRYDSGELTREQTMTTLGEELPAWFFEGLEASGGAALTEPGRTSQVTLNLEPGTYAMECYVKTPQGTYHNDRGMLRGLTVTEDSTGATPPEADAELTLSNYAIATSGEFSAGTQTVAVRVTDTPEGLMPHDINLFRLDGETATDEIAAWMDWMDLEQFRAPAPGTSVGGVEHLPAGATGYMTVDLEPGRYAWVSEGYASRGMVEEFTVE